MPGRGTTSRNVRVDGDVWGPAGAAAERYGTNRAAVMHDALLALIEAAGADPALDVTGVEVRVRVDLVPVVVTA